MSALQIETAAAFAPLLKPSRYKGCHGGRGSGKSHFFAELLVETALLKPGLRALCVREVQKSLKESAKRLIEDKIASLGVGAYFEVLQSEIRTPGGGIFSFTGMKDHTAESVKSFEGYDVAWVEEASSLSDRSLTLLRPTIRKDGSEIWASWNPRFSRDPIDQLLRGEAPAPDAIVVEANWRDNPWFPATLNEERLFDQAHRPEQYGHIWEGEYAKVFEGAYYAEALALAQKEGRISTVARDPMLPIRAYWDLGVSDSTAIWVAQFVGQEIRVLDYCEAQGQPLGFYADWLRSRDYAAAECVLPHDGAHRDAVSATRFEDHLRSAGFRARTVPNQGRGAAMRRIEAMRRLFPRMRFDAERCKGGLEALGAYHERRDEDRNIGLGPEHDWSSHGADAAGLMATDYEEPNDAWSKPITRRIRVV